MRKIYVITGSRGSGKSTAIATFPPPNEIERLCVFDCEDSMSDLVHLGFKHIRLYDKLRVGGDILERLAKGDVPWADQKGKNALISYYEYFVDTLDKTLENGKYKYFGLDTCEPIEAAMTAAVESGRRVFGWSGTRAYGRMEVEGVRPLYTGMLEAIAQRGVEYIILASHLKSVWADDKPVLGKVKPGGRLQVLTRLSSIMLWLVAGNDPHGAPAALVLKARLGKIKVKDNRWQIRRVLPERIPVFTWDAIERYREAPADLANPADGERMSIDERQMISELLTDAQMRLMILAAEERVKESAGTGMLTKSPRESVDVLAQDALSDKKVSSLGRWIEVTTMILAGASNAEIHKETGKALPEIIKARKRLE